MDFITGLPKPKGFDAILVIVDRFTKFLLYIACNKTCNARQLAELCLEKGFLFFGTPDKIISVEDLFLHHSSGENLLLP